MQMAKVTYTKQEEMQRNYTYCKHTVTGLQ